MKRLLIGLVAIYSTAISESFFEQAKMQFDDKNYTKALPLFISAAKINHDEEAAYYLGRMFESGLGVSQDMIASHYWYKRASKSYYELNSNDADYSIDKERRAFVRGIDINDTEAKESLMQKATSRFGLKAYRANYFLPASCGDFDYKTYVPSDQYNRCEAELQLSFMFDLFRDIFGFDEIYSIAYTQRSYWQIYSNSKPFRETNYNPEFMITIPWNDKFGDIALTALQLHVAHQSNGQGNITEQGFAEGTLSENVLIDEHPEWVQNRSRSWNYISASLIMQYRSLFATLTGWLRMPENIDNDDNPDLLHYLGHGSLNLFYPNGRNVYELMLRQNFHYNKGAVELTWTRPFYERGNTYWYIKLFSGYGESLIDYNNYVNKVAVGLSFSR